MRDLVDFLNQNQGAFTVVFSAVVAGATLVLAGITAYYAYLTRNLLKSQVEPIVDFELAYEQGEERLVVGNGGAYQVVDVSVKSDAMTFVGPPVNRPGAIHTSGRKIPGRTLQEWWRLEKLRPGEVQTHPIADVVESALKLRDMMDTGRLRGEESGGPPAQEPRLYTFVVFHLTFHRDFDHKRYTIRKVAWVNRETGTGKPITWDADIVKFEYFQQMLQQLREHAGI